VLESAEEEMLVPDVALRLAEIHCPTLVAVGAEDVADLHDLAARLRDGIPGAAGASIPGAAHLPQLERPAELNEAMLGFLGELGRS
jgi:pimeloyl-ACP methyl ester carboxylesterase